MISNSTKYAIKAVLFLALNSNEEKRVMVKDIASPIKVPQAYTAKLLQELSRQGVISSKSGPHGGFYLSEDNRDQPLINIVNVIDGENRLQACVLDLDKCDEEKPCPLHHVVHPTKSILLDYLSSKTIRSFTKQFQLGNDYIPLI
jgi:Rrf2 family protein